MKIQQYTKSYRILTAFYAILLFRLVAEITMIKCVPHSVFYLTPNICELSPPSVRFYTSEFSRAHDYDIVCIVIVVF